MDPLANTEEEVMVEDIAAMNVLYQCKF